MMVPGFRTAPMCNGIQVVFGPEIYLAEPLMLTTLTEPCWALSAERVVAKAMTIPQATTPQMKDRIRFIVVPGKLIQLQLDQQSSDIVLNVNRIIRIFLDAFCTYLAESVAICA